MTHSCIRDGLSDGWRDRGIRRVQVEPVNRALPLGSGVPPGQCERPGDEDGTRAGALNRRGWRHRHAKPSSGGTRAGHGRLLRETRRCRRIRHPA